MAKSKLKLEEFEIESFEVGGIDDEGGTVEANELRTADNGTCRGQTGICTGCTPIACY
jgi:hypothetical protein